VTTTAFRETQKELRKFQGRWQPVWSSEGMKQGIIMIAEVCKMMVDVMAARGLAFGGMDIPESYLLVEGLFTPDEAAFNKTPCRPAPSPTYTAVGRIDNVNHFFRLKIPCTRR
jgi:hypothetical protein